MSRAGRMRALQAVRESEEGRRRAEEASARQREELAHALRVATLGELTASFAHEINQPLAAIMTNAQCARRLRDPQRERSDEVDEVLVDIAQDAKRASETIRRLQTLFRKQHFERTEVDVNALIEDIGGPASWRHREQAHPRPPRPGGRATAGAGGRHPAPAGRAEPDHERVRGDGRERRGLARDHGSRPASRTPAGSPSPSATRASRSRKAELERIFEHFVSSKPHGLGMGLAISRSIVQAHGGRIWASRNRDRGLTLHVEIPLPAEASRREATRLTIAQPRST